jgi:hypothetical protein
MALAPLDVDAPADRVDGHMSRQGGSGFKTCSGRTNFKPEMPIGGGNWETVSIGAVLI